MNVSDTLRALLRRWYVVVPGLVVAVALAAFVFTQVKVEYERSANMLLLPAEMSIPEGSNPFLYISGLGPTADVLVRAVGAPVVLDKVKEEHPDVDVVVGRDPSAASPFLLITVTSTVDSEAATVLDTMVENTHQILAQLQDAESIVPENQITVTPLTVDTEGTASQKTRIMAAGGVGLVLTVLTILAAALVDTIAGRRQAAARARRVAQAATTALPAVKPLVTPVHGRTVASRVGGR